MLLLLSPSKTQDFETPPQTKLATQPRFLSDSQLLIDELKKFSKPQLAKLMSVSEKIADLNYDRYKKFELPFMANNAKPALLAFKGDVYTDFELDTYDDDDFQFAQKHLRTISGLYGLLRPLDLIQPYRLEMKTKLNNPRGKDLYQFWDGKLTDQLREDLDEQGDDVIVNLASQEYWKVFQPTNISARIITPVFLNKKDDEFKMIALFAKRARGTMANYIIKNHLERADDIKKFTDGGYTYSEKLSNGNEWVFVR